jgi:hypothetical protein
MSPKSLAGTILAALTAATWAPMQAPAQEAPRSFANFPLLIDPAPPNDRSPFHFAAHHISTDSNAVAFHMEWFGVPWREFASGRNPPEAWLREMDAIRGLEERLGLPVYMALTPIGGNRDRLAASPAGTYALTQDDSFGSRCESIETRPDYETVIRPGFQRYVSYMIRRFQPRFLALSIEANIYQYLCPAAWNAMQQLLNEPMIWSSSRTRICLSFTLFKPTCCGRPITAMRPASAFAETV